MRPIQPLTVAFLLVGLLLLYTGGGTSPAKPNPTKVTAVTYVHDEKANIPTGVTAALNDLNAKGIMATDISDDITDGDGQIPKQYQHTIPAAKTAGIPVLVIQAGDTILKTLKSPTTKDQVLQAVGL